MKWCNLIRFFAFKFFFFLNIINVNITSIDEKGVEFTVSGKEDAQLTIGLAEDETYTVFVNGEKVGDMKTNMSGKLSLSVELSEGKSVEVKVVRK